MTMHPSGSDNSVATRTGTTAVITGGARGFGNAFGAALSASGAHVALIDRDEPAVEAAAADIRSAGDAAVAYAGDVTDGARLAEIMADVAATNGGVDVLVNNVGLHTAKDSGPILEMGMAKTRKLFDVNVLGVVACTLAAVPYTVDRPGASIVNIASAAGHLGGTAYGVSKLAVAVSMRFPPAWSSPPPSAPSCPSRCGRSPSRCR
jgi:3-oxoacyl-[acyl-carrier protein] reductase